MAILTPLIHSSTLTSQLKYYRCHYRVFPAPSFFSLARYLHFSHGVSHASNSESVFPHTHTHTSLYRMTDDIVSYQQTAENLKLKLSLKKQIWTGTICTLSQQPMEKIHQPLSWGVPAIVRRKQPKYDENEELLT